VRNLAEDDEENTADVWIFSVVHEVLSGQAQIALAITEPTAGSDVQGIETEAALSKDGKHFLVNGQKKVCSACPDHLISAHSPPVDNIRNVFKLLLDTRQRDK